MTGRRLKAGLDRTPVTGKADSISDPTEITYSGLSEAYDFFNAALFDGRLPHCLITLQRRAGSYGYFAHQRFGDREGAEITDEIALNPVPFKTCSTEEILSTLVHEMTHLAQHHFGKPGRRGYHNKEWALMMEERGLMPSNTGEHGGKRTGQHVSHYIIPDGPFVQATAELIAAGGEIRYIDRWDEGTRRKKAASKTKFTCPACGANAWGNPNLVIDCHVCQVLMPSADDMIDRTTQTMTL
jgi:hypothetical protein